MADEREVMIEGKRVYLTALQMENLYTHFEWNNDPELNRLDSESPLVEESLAEFKERFERVLYHPFPNEKDFEIHTRDGHLIGVAYLSGINPFHRRCMLGLTIGAREFWGQQYGRETLEVLLDHCFNELKMHRVATETFEYNESWKSLVVRAGFKKEGVEREYLFRDDRYWDKVIYSLLENEYWERPVEELAFA